MYLSGVSNALATVKVKIFLYLLACLYCRVYCYQNTEENRLGRIFLEPLSSHVTKMNGHL